MKLHPVGSSPPEQNLWAQLQPDVLPLTHKRHKGLKAISYIVS